MKIDINNTCGIVNKVPRKLTGYYNQVRGRIEKEEEKVKTTKPGTAKITKYTSSTVIKNPLTCPSRYLPFL